MEQVTEEMRLAWIDAQCEAALAGETVMSGIDRFEVKRAALNKVKADSAAAQVRALSVLTFEELRDVARTLAGQSDDTSDLMDLCASLRFLAGAIREAQ